MGQRGQVVSASDSQSGGPRSESHSGHARAEFVPGRPKFRPLATLVNSQLVANWLGFQSIYVVFELFVSKYSCGVPVN